MNNLVAGIGKALQPACIKYALKSRLKQII